MIDYKGMIATIKKIEKFEKIASDKSQMEKNVHLQLAMQKLASECESWSNTLKGQAELVTNGLISTVLRD